MLPLAVALVHAGAFAGPQIAWTGLSYTPRPVEIDAVKGVYKLDNGTTLKVTAWQNRVYAELGQRGVTEMVPVAEYRFVSLDRHMTMAFNPREFDGEVLLTYPADPNVAGSELATARVSLR